MFPLSGTIPVMNLRSLLVPLLLLPAAAASAQSTPSATAPGRPAVASAPAASTAIDSAVRDLTDYLSRASKLKDDDVEGRLALARWARDRQMWAQAQEMADQALYRDPGNRAAYAILQQIDEARPLPEELNVEVTLKGEMRTRFNHDFSTRNTKHFVIAFDTTDAFATQRGVSMEKAYDAFQFYFNMNKLRPRFLQHRLVMILLKDREDYLAYGRQTERNDFSWSGGFYSQRTNRSIFFDGASAPSNASYAKQTADLQSRIDDLTGKIAAAAAANGQAGLVNALTLQRNIAGENLTRIRTRAAANAQFQNNATTMHEAAHQLSFNMGIQVRSVDYPFWFSEGLACGFEVEDSVGHRGPALVNFGRIPPLKDALKKDALIPLEQIITTNPDTGAADLALYYAEAWALFHYLYKFDREGTEKYLTAYIAHAPNRPVGPDERKAIFTKAFGADLDDLSKKWVAYLKLLPARPN
jgi:hypothetical protein